MATWAFSGRSGGELHAFELGLAFRKAGHRVAVYAVAPGRLAQQAAALGLEMFSDLRRIPFLPDIVHGQHQGALAEMLIALPQTPAVFVVHDATSPLDEPFASPRISRYVAVDRRCLERIAAVPEIAPERRTMLLNFVDLDRFRPRSALPPRPERAVVFSNYAMRSTHLTAVLRGCALARLPVDVIGSGAGRPTECPETDLPAFDLVFAKARCAIEALAVGNAVILCDFAGLGPMVGPDNFDDLREWNFGAGRLTRPLDPQLIAHEIERYDASASALVSRRIRNEAGLDQAAAAWLALYRDVLAEPLAAQDDGDQLRRIARKWRIERALQPAIAQAKRLRALPMGPEIYELARRSWRSLTG